MGLEPELRLRAISLQKLNQEVSVNNVDIKTCVASGNAKKRKLSHSRKYEKSVIHA